ncbi:hypothetical protein ACIQYF_22960, partial [Pseudomonas sp. NPDC096917]|uniref:hypothetical protein n=1 Tax=Pseudomonas sp. NPDC096917 TaxID=3364483 RepID=UPI00383BB26B
THHGGWAPERNREHSIRDHAAALNVGFMERLPLTTALPLGKRFLGESEHVYEQFRFITCQGVQASTSYQHVHAQLTQLYRADAWHCWRFQPGSFAFSSMRLH